MLMICVFLFAKENPTQFFLGMKQFAIDRSTS